MTIKQKIYNIISKTGIEILIFLFPEYFGNDPIAPSDRYLEIPFVLKNIPSLPARILDVGCSGSFFPLILSSIGYDTYAVDIRKYSIINRIKYPNFHFKQEGICQTSFPDNYFDAITAISTLEHIGLSGRYGAKEDMSGDEKAVQEMKRIAKPGATILLTIPFGKEKILRPFTRIYDERRVKLITKDLIVEKEEYYFQDSNDDWFQLTKEEAAVTEATIYKFALCLLKLRKK